MITKGSIFIITSEEYTEYEPICACVASRHMDLEELEEEYFKENEKYSNNLFLNWLIEKKKYAKKLKMDELCIEENKCEDFPHSHRFAFFPVGDDYDWQRKTHPIIKEISY